MAYLREINIQRGKAGGSLLTLHPATADALGLSGRRRVLVRFGGLRREVKLVPKGEYEGEIVLSQDVMDALRLPAYPLYDLLCENGELNFGPLIGLLLHRHNRAFTQESLKKLLIYTGRHDEVRGALVAFALDRADLAAGLVEGFCYNPAAGRFEKGVFPFPAAVYRTVGLSDAWKNRIASQIGDRLFNCPYFTKKETMSWLSRFPIVALHLPQTEVYDGPEHVLEAARRHGAVFLKPSRGLGGRGIVRAALQPDGGWEFRYRENDEARTLHCKNDAEALSFLKTRPLGTGTLVQQAVALPEHNGRVYDFRCVMQKDGFARWRLMAIIGRRSAKNGVVSNISSGGRAFRPEDMPETEISPPGYDPQALREKLAAFAYDVCEALDGCGVNCGTLGVDIGVDKKGRLWLFEVNNRDPDPTLALNLGDRALYRRLKTGPLFYARSLAGFPPDEQAREPDPPEEDIFE